MHLSAKQICFAGQNAHRIQRKDDLTFFSYIYLDDFVTGKPILLKYQQVTWH